MRYCGYPERILSLSKESRRVMLRRISLAEEFEDTTGVSPWSFIDYIEDYLLSRMSFSMILRRYTAFGTLFFLDTLSKYEAISDEM